jgi:hypothetical protein
MQDNSTQNRRRPSYLLYAVVILVVAGLGIGIVLLPRSISSEMLDYQSLTANQPEAVVMRVVEGIDTSGTETLISEPALTFRVDPDALTADFAVALTERDDLIPPEGTMPIGAIMAVATSGTPPAIAQLQFHLLDEAQPALLDIYAHDGQIWRFLPSTVEPDDDSLTATLDFMPERVGLFQADTRTPIVITQLGFGQTLHDDAEQVTTILSPVGIRPTDADATLTGNLAPGFASFADYALLPVIRNYSDLRAIDTGTVDTLLRDPFRRADHIEHIIDFVTAGNYDGVFIDYRGLTAEHRDDYSTFAQDLAERLDGIGASLGVVIPLTPTPAYDRQNLGTHADLIQISTGIDPALYAPDGLIATELTALVREIPRSKIIMGLHALSVQAENDRLSRIGYSDALDNLGDVDVMVNGSGPTMRPGDLLRLRLDGLRALPGSDEIAQTPFVDYFNTDDQPVSRMWLTTGRALHHRMSLLASYNIAGFAFDDLLADDLAPGIVAEVATFQAGGASGASTTTLQLRWHIQGEQGEVQSFVTGFNADVVVTLDAPEGNYSVNVEVIDGEAVSPRDSVAVALAQPSATPTALPSSTAAPFPTLTPTLIPAEFTPVPVTAQPEGSTNSFTGNTSAGFSQPGAVNVGPLNLSGFELGGHMMSAGNSAARAAMRGAGMQWIKVQVRYGPGSNTEFVANTIRTAHGSGFKILIGLVGSPNDVRAGGEGYVQGFARYAGEVAALGADAIEVWNEPNLAREWPEGQINGGDYAALLAQTYNAIKSRNPNVIVISGAPAPTGAEASFPGLVVNDDNWLRQFVAAGGLNYADCLGVHYNEGIISPTQTTGDPRGDDYYTRYLQRLLNRYWQITGGQLPMCITELGYLSSQGFGPLPPAFAWAAGVTVAQQAQWLAEAAAITAQSGRVAMMIVWNIDFTRYDSDPMAGYAIIRPDGSCPACGALAGGG